MSAPVAGPDPGTPPTGAPGARRGAADFTPLLREVGRRLRAPLPRRVRILRELASDLEALHGTLVADGVEPDEARRRAAEALVPDGSALAALERIHEPWYRRLTRGETADRVRRLERGALAVLTAAVLALAAATLLRADLLSRPSPFLWPVLGLGALLFAVAAAKAFQLWIKGEHRAPRRGLATLLGLSIATGILGVGGVLLDLYLLAARLEADPARAEALVPAWLVRDAALLSVALLVAVSGALAWFLLRHWVAMVEAAQHDILSSPPDPFRTQPSNGGSSR